jgi:chemotaxis protein methyltransferase CheR
MEDQETEEIELELLIDAVFKRYHYDFRQYSRSSLRRRVEQAKSRFHCASTMDLVQKILHEKDFFPQILPYLTVNTTEFFRDPGYFHRLKENVFPYLKTYPSIKIWIAGCSTGEEIISFSILLKESGFSKFIIYATDINPMNLERSRRGIYEKETMKMADKNYHLAGGIHDLSDYYEAAYDSVKFKAELLSNVVFSDHSLATDTVFSEMHLISCRNVLIYFNRPLQDRVLSLFNDSLVRGGFLGLGSKETIAFSVIKDKYHTTDAQNKVYQKR